MNWLPTSSLSDLSLFRGSPVTDKSPLLSHFSSNPRKQWCIEKFVRYFENFEVT